MTFKRVITIVIDSVGTGMAPDAHEFGDEGADTLGHIAEFFEGNLQIPHLQSLGISNLRHEPLEGIPIADPPLAYYGRMIEQSAGKDSLDGHWEMMGIPMLNELATYPNGFPQDIIQKIEDYSGRKVIGNYPESGTEIIKKYGEQQMETGELIVYTSGDSVLQIAAHEDVIPLEELYTICEYARSIVNGPEHVIGRVIARPFIGENRDNFERTANRHDYALEPYGKSALNYIQEAGYQTIAIGKTYDIFSGQGFDEANPINDNHEGMVTLHQKMQKDFQGFCFVNLVDFDSKYGHRRDPEGFGKELEQFDRDLKPILSSLNDEDLLIITADHGNDPCFKGTDHTREMVPLLVYSTRLDGGASLGDRATFADLGATILDNFNIEHDLPGESFYQLLK